MPSPTPNRFRAYGWSVLAATLGVVVWGAYVRASGSGAGCGSHWPTCDGELLPRPKTLEMLVEFTHRTSSAAITLLIGVELLAAFRIFGRGHPVRKAAVASGVLLVIEALIGAALVKRNLVVHNASPVRAVWMGAHLINTFLLLGALFMTAECSRFQVDSSWGPRGRRAALLSASLVATLLVGVSGAIAALGDTLFPAASLAEGIASDFSSSAHVFLRIRIYHPFASVLLGGWLIALARMLSDDGKRNGTKRVARLLTSLVVLQFLVGTLNLIFLAPVAIQLVHLLLAALVWLSLIALVISSRSGERGRGGVGASQRSTLTAS